MRQRGDVVRAVIITVIESCSCFLQLAFLPLIEVGLCQHTSTIVTVVTSFSYNTLPSNGRASW